MQIETETSIAALTALLRVIDRALARILAERLRIVARIDQLLNTDGTNARISAAAIAAASKCSATQAAGEIALARKLSELPQVSEALANGDVTAGQISAVAAIASPGDEARALELAKTATSATLEREAAARRKDLAELRQQAHAKRFVTFKPSEDKASMTMIARGPWADTDLMKQRLEKMAAQLEKGAGASKSPFSARMYDALMNLARANHPEAAQTPMPAPASARSETPPASPLLVSPLLASPRLNARHETQASGRVSVLDDGPRGDGASNDGPRDHGLRDHVPRDHVPRDHGASNDGASNDFFAYEGSPIVNDPVDDDTGPASDNNVESDLYDYIDYDFSDASVSDFEPAAPSGGPHHHHVGTERAQVPAIGSSLDEHNRVRFPDHQDLRGTDDDDERNFDDPDEPFPHTPNPTVVVTRANTKVVVHYDARTGIVNYQNGPPIDHPRLTALLCDASLEVIHYDRGSPNGIIATQRTKTDRQARYLAHRDGPCRVPECPGVGHTHAHHLTWASIVPDRTETGGLINICNYHHNQHHDGQLGITGNAEQTITFTWTDGRTAQATARIQN